METNIKVRLTKEIKKYLARKPFWFKNTNKDFRSHKIFITYVMISDQYLVLNTTTPMFLSHNGKAKREFLKSGSAGTEKF